MWYKMSRWQSHCHVPSNNVCQKHGQWTMKHRSHSHTEWVLWHSWWLFSAELGHYPLTLHSPTVHLQIKNKKKADLLQEKLTLNKDHDSVQGLSREKWQQWWKRSLLRLHKYKQLRIVQDIFKLAQKSKVHGLFSPVDHEHINYFEFQGHCSYNISWEKLPTPCCFKPKNFWAAKALCF